MIRRYQASTRRGNDCRRDRGDQKDRRCLLSAYSARGRRHPEKWTLKRKVHWQKERRFWAKNPLVFRKRVKLGLGEVKEENPRS